MKETISSAAVRVVLFAIRRAWLLFVFLGVGCAIPVKQSGHTTHHVILGFGIFSVNGAHNEAAVVTRAHALGLQFSTAPHFDCGIGYSSRSMVSVADGAEDVRIEVSRSPSGYLIVAPKAE